jgi:hypothetical protein
MLRNKQHSRRGPPPCRPAHGVVEGDVRIEVPADPPGGLDPCSFMLTPLYRQCRRLNDAEQLHTRRLAVH